MSKNEGLAVARHLQIMEDIVLKTNARVVSDGVLAEYVRWRRRSCL